MCFISSPLESIHKLASLPERGNKMSHSRRTTFEEAIDQILQVVMAESPITVKAISDLSEVDPRTVTRILEFLIDSQEDFAKTTIRILEGKWGKVVWKRDRIDKTKLPESIRDWYIKKRFFDKECQEDVSKNQIQNTFDDVKRTSIEEVVHRIYVALEIEDDITLAELARRTKTNRRTINRALELILKYQDRIARGHITKKDLVIWRDRPKLHELDETSLKYLLKMWYCPEENGSIPDDKERELLLLA